MALNPRQQEAVDFGDGALLLLAGAGSGKTRVLVHRIARIIGERRAAPYEILAVTFTNKAARELVARCEEQIGTHARDLWAGTFHGICARLLRRHAAELGYPSSFSIFDSDDQLRLIKDLSAEANLDETVFPPEALRAFIEAQKNEAKSPAAARRSRSDPFAIKAIDLYERYQKRLRGLGAMDFGDLIVQVVRLFREQPDLLARYQQRFHYVLVDEYQDTNRAQYLMVSLLAGGHGNICVVGDDDQSIYGWRGADLRNILEFERDFPGAHVIHLDQNYRSTANIIAAAHAVIANNSERMDKQLWTENPPGALIRIYKARDERDEARYIIEGLALLGAARGDAAIFYRTNAQSRAIEEAMVEAGIPYVIVGATRFYERREIKDLLAYLRFVQNPNDDLSLARIINVPARGIGRVTWERLRERAASADVSVWTALSDSHTFDSLRGAARTRLAAFVETIGPWLADVSAEKITPLVTRIIENTGYIAYLEALPGEDGQGRIENVNELLTVAQNFDAAFDRRELDPEDAEVTALSAFLEQLALAAAVDNYKSQGRTVTMMTAHNSKGLEFRHVFLAGMEEGIFPHSRSIVDDAETGIEEERRLCYVGMTRAREELTLIHAERRHVFGSTQYNFASRFIDELPAEIVAYTHYQGAGELEGRHSPDSFGDVVVDNDHVQETESAERYRVGMKVVHPMFGVGTVRKCEASGTDEKLVVQFQRAGLKKLVARYARLEIV